MPQFPCPDPVTADVRIAAGRLEAVAEPRDTAAVEVRPADDTEASREAAEQTEVDLSGDTLTVHAPELRSWALRLRTPRVKVTVRVPAGSRGRFRLGDADLACDGDWASLTLANAAGDAQVAQVSGDLSVDTASGDLTLGHVGGELRVHSAAGNVDARRVDGAVEIKTASGDLTIREAGGDVTAKTASGDVRVEAARMGQVQVTTVSGDVAVGVVAGTGVWLDLNSVSGDTRSDLTVHGEHAPATGHELTVRARTVSGNVDVHRVTPATRT